MALLKIELMGALRVTLDGRPITQLHSLKARALLAYLAIHADREHSRTHLASLLWPEVPDAKAKTRLSDVFSRLHGTLQRHPALQRVGKALRLDSGQCQVDVHELERLCAVAQAAPTVSFERTHHTELQALLARPWGALLPGIRLADAPEFELWLAQQRALRESQGTSLYGYLQEAAIGRGAWVDVARYAQWQLQLCPSDVQAQAQLAQALGAEGDRVAVREQYAQLCPPRATEPSETPSEAIDQVGPGLSSRSPPNADDWVGHGRIDLTPLVGRDKLIERLSVELQGGAGRWVALQGPLGVGKTALMSGLYQRLKPQRDLPVAWLSGMNRAVPLSHYWTELAAQWPAVSDETEPEIALRQYLDTAGGIVLLDDFDPECPAQGALLDCLAQRARVCICLTQSEVSHWPNLRVERLPALGAEHSASLLEQALKREWPERDIADDRRALAALAEQLQGSPLALQWCAVWLAHFGAQEIAQSLPKLDRVTERRVPEAVARVFAFAWRHLSGAQREALGALSVLPEGVNSDDLDRLQPDLCTELPSLRHLQLVGVFHHTRYRLHPALALLLPHYLSAEAGEQWRQRLRPLLAVRAPH